LHVVDDGHDKGFSKLLAGDLKGFLLGCDPCCCFPKWESTQLNPRLSVLASRLTSADQFAARRNVSRENVVEAGNHTPRPCLARFAIVMNPVATSFPHEVTREST